MTGSTQPPGISDDKETALEDAVMAAMYQRHHAEFLAERNSLLEARDVIAIVRAAIADAIVDMIGDCPERPTTDVIAAGFDRGLAAAARVAHGGPQ